MDRQGISRHWRTALVVVALVAATAGGAGAKAAYDAKNARRLGGYSHAQMATQTIPPQAAYLSNGATVGRNGPVLAASGTMTVSVVVPPDHDPNGNLKMRVSFREESSGACAWYAATSGIAGPDGPNSQSNIHNGGWRVPGTGGDFEGLVRVPAGTGAAHDATFTWPFEDKPGMFVEFSLTRDASQPTDTCTDVQVVGLQLAY